MSDFKFWDKEGRELETMERYTIGIDLGTRLRVAQKLKEMGLDTPKFRKGTQAALIRCLLRLWSAGSFYVPKEIIEQEYTYTASKNKRSNL